MLTGGRLGACVHTCLVVQQSCYIPLYWNIQLLLPGRVWTFIQAHNTIALLQWWLYYAWRMHVSALAASHTLMIRSTISYVLPGWLFMAMHGILPPSLWELGLCVCVCVYKLFGTLCLDVVTLRCLRARRRVRV